MKSLILASIIALSLIGIVGVQSVDAVPPLTAIGVTDITVTGKSDVIRVGEQAEISINYFLKTYRDREFAVIFQITESDGKVLMLNWINGHEDANMDSQGHVCGDSICVDREGDKKKMNTSWIPSTSGEYQITIFAWESIDNPSALGPPVSRDITVETNPTLESLQCKDNQVFVHQIDRSSACVTESTAEKLVKRGWILYEKNVEQNSFTKNISNIQKTYAELYPVPEGLTEPLQEEFIIFGSYISKKYPNLYYEELFRSWNFSDEWIQEFFITMPQMKNEPTFVKNEICREGVFFEDPLNVLNKGDGWFSWNYLDCVYPDQLKHDLSNYDYITREDGLNMLSNYYETDAITKRKVDFNSNILYEPGPPCDSVYYHIFQYPQRVKIGQEFSLNVTYSWINPNDDWGSMTESDKNIVLQLGETARSIETQESEFEKQIRELRQDNQNNENQKEIEDLEFQVDGFNVKLDLLYNQLVSVVEKYDDVDITTIDQLLDHTSTNTVIGFDKKYLTKDCEPSIKFAVPRQMEFVNIEDLDEYGFSDSSHRHLATKYVVFNNTVPQTQSFKFIVNEPVYDLYDIIEIGIGIGFQSDLVFTISSDYNYAYFGDQIYHLNS